MSRHREIDVSFDAIVAFAGIEQFLDTPVKRYSSGMYVRLAFAVAAHLEPEILIVDEVLAVGDAEFQNNAWGRCGKPWPWATAVIGHNMMKTLLAVPGFAMRNVDVIRPGTVRVVEALPPRRDPPALQAGRLI